MKTNRDVLKLVLKEINKKNFHPEQRYLCFITFSLYEDEKITKDQFQNIETYIRHNMPSSIHYPYGWKVGNWRCRKAWLNKHIKLLTK